tara:strand:- start:2621 stop:2893 length:273 start_codon:yes stop_codon:yes gene_type:complete
MDEKRKKDYFEFLINEYDNGNTKIRGKHPKDVKIAIDTFFKAGKILVDNPESGNIPPEYVDKLLSTLAQYPEYHELVLQLALIINNGEGE